MKEYSIMDGNEACATAAYLFTEVAGIYPITPATPMATLCDKWASENRKNIFNERVSVIEMQSEAGASALVHGSLQTGSLSTTFTASQGLLLMLPSMYKMSGEMLPGVIHVAARSLSTHALSIFGDHQDINAVRSAGFGMLSSSNVQDAYYMALITHLSSISSSIPFLHFFDGFRTSHEINKIELLSEKEIYPLIDMDSLNEFKTRAINIGKNITRGCSQTEDVYFQNTEAKNKYYNDLPDVVNSYMGRINNIAGTDYKPFTYYGNKNAKHIIVAMGSVTDTIKLVIDEMDDSVGLINVHLYRPFSSEYFYNVLPHSVTSITVLDRTKELNSFNQPLYESVCSILKDENIKVIGGIYGLSSKNTNPKDIKSVFDNMNKHTPKEHFTIGINDDITNLSLPSSEFKINKDYKEIKVYGFGSDGMVSASKNILKLLGKKENTFVQGYFEYDSKKSGGVTISHLRIDDNAINAPFYPESTNLIVITRENYLNTFDCLNGIKKGGVILLSTQLDESQINEFLNNETKKDIKEKNIRMFLCNTFELNKKYSLNGKINNIMSMYILKILGCTKEDVNNFKELIKKAYNDKGESVIQNNLNSLNDAFEYIVEINNENLTINENDTNLKGDFINNIKSRNGNNMPVSEFVEYRDGSFKGGTSSSDKRKISDNTPKWIKEACIECNKCSAICPHAVIRPFSLTDSDLDKYNIDKNKTIPSIGEENRNFFISVSESNCTGCGLCIDSCPGKNGQKALEFGDYDESLDDESEKVFKHINDTKFNKYTIKGLGFKSVGFEYPGACAGCGESGYMKVLTSLYKDEIVISNATGCSSIYGGSLPNLPYKVPWVSSLFEDNAEFGFGIYMSYKTKREMIQDIMYETKDIVTKKTKDIYKEWIDNKDNFEITSRIKEELSNCEIPNELRNLIDYIPFRTVWIVGGDGWAYDIGYGGLDHVLHSNENVNILILDTEVYSNTGGQMSKSTKYASIAEFASNGKKTNKKDLFRIAMSIPNVYVASISFGANEMQSLKAFKEAYEHNGPSLIIAYSPCISHGITGGLRNSLKEEKLLVESGYNLLMRYNPNSGLTIDSKEPDFSKYYNVFEHELRYKNLKNINKDNYEKLYELNVDSAKERYIYYKKIENKESKLE